MKRKGVAHVAKINELVHLSVRIAGDVHKRLFPRRALVQAADRHDGKQLAERPMIEQRLEDREIAEKLIGKAVFKLADFFGHISLPAITLRDLAADFPV